MIEFRCSGLRGYADHGWLKSFHSFSFADYHDPARMGWGNLRVINEDQVAPGTGFGTHGHRDMEIVSVVLDGALAHRDSMGHGTHIQPGEVQRMTAGTGVRHSEFNHASDRTTHFLQIWLLPERIGLEPGYEQRSFPAEGRRGRLQLVAASDAGDDAVRLHADARLWRGSFAGAEQAELALDPTRKAYVHLAAGQLQINGHALKAGDALAIESESRLVFEAGQDADVLVFDLAP